MPDGAQCEENEIVNTSSIVSKLRMYEIDGGNIQLNYSVSAIYIKD